MTIVAQWIYQPNQGFDSLHLLQNRKPLSRKGSGAFLRLTTGSVVSLFVRIMERLFYFLVANTTFRRKNAHGNAHDAGQKPPPRSLLGGGCHLSEGSFSGAEASTWFRMALTAHWSQGGMRPPIFWAFSRMLPASVSTYHTRTKGQSRVV